MQGEDENRAGHGAFYELEKLGFFVSGVCHGGRPRLYCAFCVSVAFAMIFPARKREKSGACQNFVQEIEFAQAIGVMGASG